MDTLFGLYAAQPFWVWAGIGAAILAVEIATGSGWLLWAAASAAVTAVIAGLIQPSPATTVAIFAILTIVTTLLTRRYLPRTGEPISEDINDTASRLIGKRATAVQAFVGGAGRVMLDGKEWAAELIDGDAPKTGAPVEVVSVDGARLLVRAAS